MGVVLGKIVGVSNVAEGEAGTAVVGIKDGLGIGEAVPVKVGMAVPIGIVGNTSGVELGVRVGRAGNGGMGVGVSAPSKT